MDFSCVKYPIPSMYGIFTYIWLIFMVNVGKYTIHGWYGYFQTFSLGLPRYTRLRSKIFRGITQAKNRKSFRHIPPKTNGFFFPKKASVEKENHLQITNFRLFPNSSPPKINDWKITFLPNSLPPSCNQGTLSESPTS